MTQANTAIGNQSLAPELGWPCHLEGVRKQLPPEPSHRRLGPAATSHVFQALRYVHL